MFLPSGKSFDGWLWAQQETQYGQIAGDIDARGNGCRDGVILLA